MLHCIHRQIKQSQEDPLRVHAAETCGVEVADEELNKSRVRGEQVVHVLTLLRECFVVARREFLFEEEGIGMPKCI